jgi:hypothetical protein
MSILPLEIHQTDLATNWYFAGRGRPVAAGNNREAVVRQNAMSVQCVDRALSASPKRHHALLTLDMDDVNAPPLACVFRTLSLQLRDTADSSARPCASFGYQENHRRKALYNRNEE